jgi:hypothetical protein
MSPAYSTLILIMSTAYSILIFTMSPAYNISWTHKIAQLVNKYTAYPETGNSFLYWQKPLLDFILSFLNPVHKFTPELY